MYCVTWRKRSTKHFVGGGGYELIRVGVWVNDFRASFVRQPTVFVSEESLPRMARRQIIHDSQLGI